MTFSIAERLRQRAEPGADGAADGQNQRDGAARMVRPRRAEDPRPGAPDGAGRLSWQQIKSRVQRRLLEEGDLSGNGTDEDPARVRRVLEALFNEILVQENIRLPGPDRIRLLRQLPDALDLLTISVQAGLGFDGVMLEVVRKWRNEIADEFAIVLGEMRLGRSRRDALRDMAARTGFREMKMFVGSILQSEELGMGIARTLAIQAEQMRLRRRQRAEELARKAVIRIILPMVLFIFPSLFVVLLGPSIPAILEGLSSTTK